MTDPNSKFRKDLWIELIGFDNTQPDFGVAELLSRMPVKPGGVSILIWTTDLIHRHRGLETDGPIGPQHCSYYARPRNEEHERQDWTRFQLRGLIAELHRHQVEVWVSFFDQLPGPDFWQRRGLERQVQWADEHPEIRYLLFDGRPGGGICPWKHLADGSLYEDFFFAQLEKFLADYGFDGLHAADGYAHPRYPVCQADFSDDVIGQFEAMTGLRVPPGDTAARSAWILSSGRREWCEFHARRHARFWKKGMDMLAKHGWTHRFNHCWTRDPLEAKYRYGIDYQLLAAAGVRNWVPEAQAAVIETEGWNRSGIPMQDVFRAMIPRLAAALPGASLQLLNCIKDGMEQYNVLRHAPAFMDSDIYSICGTLCGGRRSVRGVLTCLADGISPAEWQRIDRSYSNVGGSDPAGGCFPAVVWSDRASAEEFAAYCKEPFCSSFTLHAHLISQGAVLPDSVRLGELDQSSSVPLVVLHPKFFTERDLAAVHAASRGNYAEIGLLPDNGFGCRIAAAGIIVHESRTSLLPCERTEITDWRLPLPEMLPEDGFCRETAEQLNRFLSPARAKDPADRLLRLWGYWVSPDRLKLFAGSENRCYSHHEILIKGDFVSAEAQSSELVLPPGLKQCGGECCLSLKIPPSGTIPVLLEKRTGTAAPAPHK